jgi:hypothetical protein
MTASKVKYLNKFTNFPLLIKITRFYLLNPDGIFSTTDFVKYWNSK